jgi:hypothetical protein
MAAARRKRLSQSGGRDLQRRSQRLWCLAYFLRGLLCIF